MDETAGVRVSGKGRFQISVAIQAPPEKVWAVTVDVEHWNEWTPSVTNIQLLKPGPLTAGSRALIRQPKLPPAIWQVTGIDAGKEFTWVTRSPGIRITGRHSVEAAGGGSRATLSLEFAGLLGPLMARLTRGLNRRYLTLEAEGLKQRSEAY